MNYLFILFWNVSGDNQGHKRLYKKTEQGYGDIPRGKKQFISNIVSGCFVNSRKK